MTSRRLFWILLAGLCLAGAWARTANFRSVLVAGEVVRGAAGPTGVFQLVVAYPGAYAVRVGEVALEVRVEEDDVSAGARLAVAPPRP